VLCYNDNGLIILSYYGLWLAILVLLFRLLGKTKLLFGFLTSLHIYIGKYLYVNTASLIKEVERALISQSSNTFHHNSSSISILSSILSIYFIFLVSGKTNCCLVSPSCQ